MKFIREWQNPLGLVVVVITIISTIVLTSRALVTKDDFERARKEVDSKIEQVSESTDAKIRASQSAQERYFEEYIKNAANWAADRAARKAVREYVQFTRSGKLPPDEND